MNANSLEKEWKPLKNSCYPLEKERNEKKVRFFTRKRVRVNTSEHHSKMYCPLFNSLKNGHSLAESERHSFSSEYSTILLVLLTIHSKRSEVHSQRVNVHSLKIYTEDNTFLSGVHFHSFFTLFRVKNLTFFSLFSLFRVDNSFFLSGFHSFSSELAFTRFFTLFTFREHGIFAKYVRKWRF